MPDGEEVEIGNASFRGKTESGVFSVATFELIYFQNRSSRKFCANWRNVVWREMKRSRRSQGKAHDGNKDDVDDELEDDDDDDDEEDDDDENGVNCKTVDEEDVYLTKGDANFHDDLFVYQLRGFTHLRRGQIAGKVRLRIPILGRLREQLRMLFERFRKWTNTEW